ncbi:hypothetical protein PY365_04800 [Roseiarcaceae bacterium H3SJ34-1]|uniref:hypothetical protein n=1 Tax=Terripilifer ovatus TaxID=3032367 RepID=UPI003AB9AB3F|nr:hypothetical protein [Roseiarcaceae bacterium H3SJ34-1]
MMNIQRMHNIADHLDRGCAAIAALMPGGEVTPEDVARLRRTVFAQASVGRAEAEALFAIERSAVPKCKEWTAFFVEAITDHIVWQVRPTGVVNTPQAEWLIQQADQTRSLNAFAALVNVLAEAHRVPGWLPAAVKGRAGAGWPGLSDALHEAERLAA